VTDATPALPHRVLYRDAALADGRSGDRRLGQSVLVDDDRIAWIRPTDGEDDPGPRIASGTDFGGGSLRANQLAWEVESLVAAGLEPWEALGAASWRGGELLGEPDAGSLREEGPADFVLVHGDPLSDPTALWRVWRVSWAPDPVAVQV
jgi:hypothetical protein